MASGQLQREADVTQFACGYAVGAMFAKFGLQAEVTRTPSARAKAAMTHCQETTTGQTNPPAAPPVPRLGE
jgi:hypothetical protein